MSEVDLENRFRRNDSLIRNKLLQFLPAMVATNLSSFILLSVDGLIVGNFVNTEALAAISIFYPATAAVGVPAVLLASGAASSISTCMGKNDVERLHVLKKAVLSLLVIASILTSIIQIPIIYGIIRSYNLSPQLAQTAWQYGIGIMIATPLGLIATVGIYLLQILGKTKPLMWLATIEGITNVVLDLIFVCVFNMGVLGASMATACANLFKCVFTLFYLIKKTDMYKTGGAKLQVSAIGEVLSAGLPEASNSVGQAIRNYFLTMVIVAVFGEAGGVIAGVSNFCYGICNIFIGGIQSSMRPICGLLCGADDRKALHMLLNRCIQIVIVIVGVLIVIMEVFPGLFFTLHGVKSIPVGGLLSLRLASIQYVCKGLNTLFRLYFSNRKDSRFASALILTGSAALPIYAWILAQLFPAPFLWLCYMINESWMLGANVIRYRKWLHNDSREADPSDRRIYLTVEPDSAIEASRMIRNYGSEHGFSLRMVYRIGLCMEEMVAYAVKSQKNRKIRIQVEVLFTHKESRFTILDNGSCIALNEDSDSVELRANNYEIVKKIADTVNYQYILNMNYSVLTFRGEKAKQNEN